MRQADDPNIISRREILTAAVPIAAVAASLSIGDVSGALAAVGADPKRIAALANEWFQIKKMINASADDDGNDAFFARLREIDQELIAARTSDPSEAIELLKVARSDFIDFHSDGLGAGHFEDDGEEIVFSAIENAIRALQALNT